MSKALPAEESSLDSNITIVLGGMNKNIKLSSNEARHLGLLHPTHKKTTISWKKLTNEEKAEMLRLMVMRHTHANTEDSDKTPRRLSLPPGTLAGRIFGLFMTKSAYRRWVYPAIAEMQAEYFEELAGGRLGRARWVWFRGIVYLIPGWVWGLVARTVKWWLTPSQ